MNREDLEKVMYMLLENTPEKITSKDVSIIFANFMVYKGMANYWPDIENVVEEVMIEHLIKQSMTLMVEKNEDLAIKDANNFLEKICNGAG
jgi:hypothetical protein